MIKKRIGILAFILFALLFAGCITRSALVTFESNGGTPVQDVLVPIGGTLEEPKEPTKEGYEFGGWYSDMDLNEEYDFQKPVEKNMTLYAKWIPAKYTITWDTMGGSEIEPTEVSYKGSIKAPEEPVREGYVFKGWYYEPEHETPFDFRTLMPAQDFTLYALWELGEYTVTFETFGGSAIAPIEGTYGDEFDIPEPNRFGYTFAGWYLDEEFTEEFTEFEIPPRNTVLYAKWNPIDIEVTFLVYPGNSYTVAVKFNEKLEMPETPQRTGFTFVAWLLDGEIFDFDTPITEEIILEGNWDRNKYTVTFETDGGSAVEAADVLYNRPLERPEDPVKTGHDFIGWFKDAEYETPWDFEKDLVTEDITLYAKWEPKTYTISFFLLPIDPITQKYGTPLTAPTDPEREGHSFAGWYRDSGFTKPFVFPETMPAEDILLYARWTTNEYRVRYFVDGELYYEALVSYGEEIPAINDPEKVGHTFVEWEGLPEKMPAEDLEVEAVFDVNNYKLTYYLDGESYRSFDVPYGAPIEPITAPAKTGYTFQGWNEIPATMPAEDVNVYGTYAVNHYQLTIIVDPVRGSVTVEPNETSIAYGTEVTVTAIAMPGYKFSHWDSGSGFVSDEAVHTFTMPANNLTLTAIFAPEDDVEYKVKYFLEDLDGNFVLHETRTHQGTTGTTVTALIRTYTGFTHDPEHEGNILSGVVAGDGSLELYVYYERNTYTLTYLVDGEVYLEEEYKYEAPITLPEVPEKTGHTFVEWEGLPEKMPAEDLEVEAVFDVNNYKLTYYLDGESYRSFDVPYGAPIEPITAPAKTGYTFQGWNEIPATMPAEDVNVYGTYAVNHYQLTIIVDPVRGSVTVEPNETSIAYGTEITVTAIAMPGYKFSHWESGSGFVSDEAVHTFTMPANDLTLTAIFAPEDDVEYKVKYFLEDLDGNFVLHETRTHQGTTGTTVTAPIRTYTGFTHDPEHEGNILSGVVAGDGSLELYVYYERNTYTLTYLVDGEVYLEEEYKYEAPITLPEVPEKTGHTFVEWEGLPEKMPAEDLEVEAVFDVNNYKLTYYLDGESYRSFDVPYGAPIEPITAPAKTGYTFQGWNEIPATMPAEDVNVYGTYAVNHYQLTIIVDPVRGSVTVEPNETSIAYGTEVTVTAIAMPGYKFSHWDSGSVLVSDEAVHSFTMPANDLTLTAVFNPRSDVEYKVKYFLEDLDGNFVLHETRTHQGTTGTTVTALIRTYTGFTHDPEHEGNILSGVVAGDGSLELHVYYERNTYTLTYLVDGEVYLEEEYKFEAQIILPDDSEKVGYSFQGWVNLPATMPANDLVVEAEFDLIEYSITYVLNEGSFAVPQRESYTIENEFTIDNPTREYHVFLGWTFEGQSEPVKNLKINRGTYGDLVLTAHWEEIVYEIIYIDGSNQLFLEPNFYSPVSGADLPEPSKIGQTFEGWFADSEFSGEAIEKILPGETGDRIFFAKFVPITYEITYFLDLEIVDDPNLIYEYTYSDTQDVVLKLLPADEGYFFAWYTEDDEIFLRIPAGTTGNLVLHGKYTQKFYDVAFYHDRGDLIGIIRNAPYGSQITLTMAFAGEPEHVEALKDLNEKILLLGIEAINEEYFSAYLESNAAKLSGISPALALAIQAVYNNPGQDTIDALLLASQAELSVLGTALDLKIAILQELKVRIEAVVSEEPGSGDKLFRYLFITQGAYAGYLEELSAAVDEWVSLMVSLIKNGSTDQEAILDALQRINSYANFELNNSAQIRHSFRKDHPTKQGYIFNGWKIGDDTLYHEYGPGYLFEGTIVMAPASEVPGEPAKVIASYRRLQEIPASFNSGNNLLTWSFLTSEDLEGIYDSDTESVKIYYDVYIGIEVGGSLSHYHYGRTEDNKVVLEDLGTYIVKVIPVVEIYEGDILINTVSANPVTAEGMEVEVKKVEDEAVIDLSGNYYHRMTEGNKTVFYFFSNTEITFPSAEFTILSGSQYVSVENGNTLVLGDQYTTPNSPVEFTFTASAGGTVYTGRIYPYISQFNLGPNLTSYLNTVNNIEDTLYYNKDVEPYYVGKALSGDADVLGNQNAFHFELLVKTAGGKNVELLASQLDFKAYEVLGENEEKVVTISETTSGDWEIYRSGEEFYFRESGKTYRIVIEIKDAYVPKALKPDPEDPSKPALIKPKSFTVTVNDGVNVFTNEQLQIAFGDTTVKAINIHSNIEAKLRDEQTYRVGQEVYPYNFYASQIVKTLHPKGEANMVGNVYQRISPADSENPDNVVINGNYFTIDGSKLPYTNYGPEGLQASLGDGTTLTQPGALNTIPGYNIRNVQIAIFNHIALDEVNPAKVNYGGVLYKNLTVIGNTHTPHINYSEGTDKIEEALAIMSRNSGGYVAIANNYNLTLAVDNVVIGSSTIAVWSNTETEVIINNAHLYNNWANTVYGYDVSSLYIANAVLEESGGSAIHLEDTNYSSDYAQTVIIDTATVEVNNWVSGEEPWFKAYSMELAAMKMKAQINSGVKAAFEASILRNITDVSSGLMSRKMNFVLLVLPKGRQVTPNDDDKNLPEDKQTKPGYSDITLYMLQSQNPLATYDYGETWPYDESKYVVPISEAFFEGFALASDQTYGAAAAPFGEITPLTLGEGISDVGPSVLTNFLAVQVGINALGYGSGIAVIGLDNPPKE